MHRLIAHFPRIAPTWLLLDMDWVSTKQAAPFVVSCTGVLPIGRVKWIEGSKYTGKDNFGWYRFEAGHLAVPSCSAAIRRDAAAESASSAGSRTCRAVRIPGPVPMPVASARTVSGLSVTQT